MSNSPNIPTPDSPERLPRSDILSHRGWVKKMFDSGTRHHHRLLSLIELQKPQPCPEVGKVAFFTPKKVGRAVDRNRVRRQMKEAYRRHLQSLHPQHFWIWLAKPAAVKSNFDELLTTMERLAQKAHSLHSQP